MNDNQTIDPKVISRIQKMLNLARDGAATEGEARNAMDAVEATMRKYNLTMAQVEAAGGAGGEGSKRTKDALKGRAQYEFQQQLMAACAEVNYCVVLRTSQWKGNRSMVTGYVLIGREANVIATRELFDYLNSTIERLAFEYVDSDNKRRLSREAISFKKGAAERLGERLGERHRESLEEQAREARERNAASKHPGSTSTALVVVMKDFAQEEADANNDMRWGLEPGSTAKERQLRKAQEAVWVAARDAVRRAPGTEYDELMGIGCQAAAPVAESFGVSEERMRSIVEGIVGDILLARLRKPEKPETPAQQRKREEQQRRANERYWEQQRRARAREARNTDWTAKAAGERAGDTVGLDKQVKDGPSPAGRLK